jgi:hypothetical protein
MYYMRDIEDSQSKGRFPIDMTRVNPHDTRTNGASFEEGQ